MKGFDCNTPLSLETAKAFKADGYQFVFRYVGRMEQKPHDLSKAELDAILSSGLGLGVVQHVAVHWVPTLIMGKTYGSNAARFAGQCGYRPGNIIFLDLEDVAPGTPRSMIIAYCNAWYDAVKAGGYVPGIYIGFNSFLTGTELYHRLKFAHYWKSLSNVPDVEHRGYEMFQGRQVRLHGILIDPDTITGDQKGNQPILMTK